MLMQCRGMFACMMWALLTVFAPKLVFAATDIATIPGLLDVGNNGSAAYSIGIRVAPGTGGTEPKLALTYNSQSPPGVLGAGWTLTGVSTITRGPRNRATDGRIAGVELTEDDALFLDGQRLLPISASGSGANLVIEYRKEADDVARIRRVGADMRTARFTVETKGGARLVFDGSNGSRISLSDGVALLMTVSRVEDTAGNYVDYVYESAGGGDYRLTSIRYTGHRSVNADGGVTNVPPYARVELEYSTAERPLTRYVAGRRIDSTSILSSVVSVVSRTREGNSPAWLQVARYDFEYRKTETWSRFVLTAVHEFGEDGSVEKEPTRFAYSPAAFGLKEVPASLPFLGLAQNENIWNGYRFEKFDAVPGSGVGLLFSVQMDGGLESAAFRNDRGVWKREEAFNPPFAFVAANGTDLGVVSVDVDGDGRVDLLKANSTNGISERKTFLARDKWSEAPGYALPFDVMENGVRKTQLLIGRFSGSQGPDVLYQSSTTSGFLRNTGTGWSEDSTHGPPVPIDGQAMLLDVDCDGRPEIVSRVQVDGEWRWKVFKYAATQWEELDSAFAPKVPASIERAALLPISLNGDSCTDLLVASGKTGVHKAFIATATGWVEDVGKVPPFDLTTSSGLGIIAVAADFNGDGRADVVANWKGVTGEVVRFAYAQTGSGWSQLPATFIPVIASSSSSAPAVVVDIDGDGINDLAWPVGGRSGFGRVFIGSASGFLERPDYAPPMAFSRRDRQDRGVRFVDLNGDGLIDVVFRRDGVVAGQGPESGAFLNTANGWIAAPGLVPPLPIAGAKISGDAVRFVDVDGDGFVDLLYNYIYADGTQKRAFYHNEADANGNRHWVEVADSKFLPPLELPFAKELVGDLGVRFIDLNGDGRPDIISGSTLPVADPPEPVDICTAPADGGTPACELNRKVFATKAYLNTGSGWTLASSYAPPLPLVGLVQSPSGSDQDLHVELVDVNGDGLPDIVARFRHPLLSSKEVNEVWRNTGDGWAKLSDVTVPVALDATRWDGHVLVQWMDVNADGLADIVVASRHGGTNDSSTWISTGHGFRRASEWDLPVQAIADRTGDLGFRLADVDGDGLPDIVYARMDDNGATTSGIYLNTGNGWRLPTGANATTLPSFTDQNGQDLGVRLVDFDGDGLPDVISSYATTVAGQTADQKTFLNIGRRADMLTTIGAGHGLDTAIIYQTLQEANASRLPSDTTKAAPWERVYVSTQGVRPYPLVSTVPTTYVVRRVVISRGAGDRQAFSYRYGDFAIDVSRMRSLGFGWRESLNENTSVLTRLEFLQTWGLVGRSSRESSCLVRFGKQAGDQSLRINLCPPGTQLGQSSELTRVENTWQSSEVEVGGGSIPKSVVTQSTLDASKSTIWEFDGAQVSQTVSRFYYDEPAELLDRRMNTTRVVTTRSDGTETDTRNEYAADDPLKWMFGRLTRSEVKRTGDKPVNGGTPDTESRATEFEYDPATGLLRKETSNPGHPLSVSRAYMRDVYGNITSAVTSAAGGLRRETSTTFDELGRFVLQSRVVGAGKQFTTNRTLRPTTGAEERVEDVENGTVRSFTFDSLGRIATVKSPSGIVTRTEYLALSQLTDVNAAAGLAAVYAVRTTQSNKPPRLALHDNRGQLLRTVAEGFTADEGLTRPVQVDTVYDALGRVIASSLPYDRGQAPSWARVDYDAIGRATRRIAPNGALTRFSYAARVGGGRVQTKFDSLGVRHVVELNERGLPVATTDAGRKAIYRYDAADHSIEMTSPLGRSIRAKFVLDQRTLLIDPDSGTWHYAYDAFGQLLTQTNAKGEKTFFSYDDLGRIRTRSVGDQLFQWGYDEGPNASGRLTRYWETDKFEKTLRYDPLGNLDQVTTTLNGRAFTTSYERNDEGQVTKLTYPRSASGFQMVAVNHFDRKGFLYRVTDSTGLSAYWDRYATDAGGRTTKARAGGSLTTREFDSNTGAMKHDEVVGYGGEKILGLELDYDVAGQLTSRRESVIGASDKFAYDNLLRLSSVTDKSGVVSQVKYDDGGRVLFRTGVGNYQYSSGPGAWQPFHGVSATVLGGVAKQFSYDPNGNLEKGPDADYRYTADNRLSDVRRDAKQSLHFDYAADGALYRKFALNGKRQRETLVVDLFEQVADSATGVVGGPVDYLFRYALTDAEGIFATVDVSARMKAPGGAVEQVGNSRLWYLHRDQLGSIVRITDEEGHLAARFWYDAWGLRTLSSVSPAGGNLAEDWNRGFGGHEYFADFELIHMGGRVYNAKTGLFLTPDPSAQAVSDSQGFNRYIYANNNPFLYTDPSGYWGLGSVLQDIGNGVGHFVHEIGHGVSDVGQQLGCFFRDNWREVVVVAVAIVVTVACDGVCSPIVAGMLAGGAASATGAILYGGSFEDVMVSAVKGAVIGGVSAGLYQGAGEYFGHSSTSMGAAAAHGFIGGATEAAQGGDFWRGFVTAAAVKVSNQYIPEFEDNAASIARSAAIGGTVSSMTGGKFANGAMIGAFSRAFNDLACKKIGAGGRCWGDRPTKEEIDNHYRDMTGWPVEAGSMDPSWLDASKFEAIPIGTTGLVETSKWSWLDPIGQGDRNIYGSFTATRVDENHFTFRDTYNFDQKEGGSWLRNMATRAGEWTATRGTHQGRGFDIINKKPVEIPGRNVWKPVPGEVLVP